MNFLNSYSFNLVERALDLSTFRQNLLSNNIANAETPGYKRSDIRFEEELKKAMGGSSESFEGLRTNPRHLIIGQAPANNALHPQIQYDRNTAMNNNGNNVDMDYEMAEIAKNTLRYNVLVQQMNQQLAQVRTAINEGGR